MKTIHRTIVAGMLVSHDNKVLIGKVRRGGVYPNCWHIPSGGVDAGETQGQALIRELKEELGLDIHKWHHLLIRDEDTGESEKTDKLTGEKMHVIMQFNVFRVDVPLLARDVPVSLDDDLVEYKWVAFAELKNYDHTPPSIKLFTALGYINTNQ